MMTSPVSKVGVIEPLRTLKTGWLKMVDVPAELVRMKMPSIRAAKTSTSTSVVPTQRRTRRTRSGTGELTEWPRLGCEL